MTTRKHTACNLDEQLLHTLENRTGALRKGPLRGKPARNDWNQPKARKKTLVGRKTPGTAPGCHRRRNYHGVNLYPTPLIEWKCLGIRGSASKYFLKATMKLSTVRVVGNTL